MTGKLAAATLALALAIVADRATAEDTYTIDPVHSQPIFEARHMGFSQQRGSFGKSTGKITLDPAAKKGTVEILIDATSIGDRVVQVDGDLTMLGVTKPVTLKVATFLCGPNPMNKKPMCGAEASATIKRSEWGMTYGIPQAVSDEIKLTIPIEAYKE